jgi:putative tryptophan/tyrosine transport system substrate-binding protein
MRRREFIALLGGAAFSWPGAARGQQTKKPLIGFLHSATIAYIRQMSAAMSQGLKETGYIEGENIAIEYRSAEGVYDRLPALAAELAASGVDVIVAAGGVEPTRAAIAATKTIPIVFISATDPVAAGLVPSLSHPGGNVTGVSLIGVALEGKRLELLHQLAPKATILAAMINPNYPAAATQSQELQEAAGRLKVGLLTLKAATATQIEAAFATLAERQAGGVLVAQDPFLIGQREQITALALRYIIPAVYSLRESVLAGGLASYGPVFSEGYRQVGVYVGRILKGEKPADLPIMQPTKFELVINLKTAKTLGLEVPPMLLATADEVIE